MVAQTEDDTSEVENTLLESEKETTEKNDKGVENEEDDGVPVDRGWAYVIVVCILLNSSIIIGFQRALSVLFIDIRDAFQEPSTIITLMFTIHALCSSISSVVVSNIFMRRFSVRCITVVAALLNGITTVFVSQAPNIVLFLLLFIFKGLSFGALLVCPMSLIGYYFKKRRAFASAVGGSGFCVAFIVFPLLTEALRTEYGFRGALLFTAAIELHLVAVNMLLRPVESFKKLHAKKLLQKKLEEEKKTPIYRGPPSSTTVNPRNGSALESEHYDKGNGIEDHRESENSNQLLGDKTIFFHQMDYNDDTRQRSNSDARYIVRTVKDNGHSEIEIPYGSPPMFTSLKDLSAIKTVSTSVDTKYPKNNQERPRYSSQLSAISTTELPINPELFMQTDKQTTDDDIESVKGKRQSSCGIGKIIDVTLFQNWLFIMVILFVPLCASTQYLIIYMPAIATTSGVSKSDAALYMTIGGVMDLSARIILGYIGDYKWVSKPKLVVFSVLVISLVCQFSRFFNTQSTFIVFAILVGTFGGVRQNFLHVLLIEYVGVDKMAKAFGLCAMAVTLCLSINHPIVGAMFDATGGFTVPLHYVGVLVFAGTVILACEPFFRRLQEKKEAREAQQRKK